MARMTTEEIDAYLEKLPRSVLLTLIHSIMDEYQQVKHQVHITMRVMSKEVTLADRRVVEEHSIEFPSKDRGK